MKRYEYRVEKWLDAEQLTALGDEGWRVVTVMWRNDDGKYYGDMDRILLERDVSADPMQGGVP